MIDGGTGLIWHGHHSLFDASSMPSFFDAVERTLSGKPDTNTSLVPHKLWADSLYNLSSSQSKCSDFDRLAYEAASQCADQSHLTRGRSLFRNARQNGPNADRRDGLIGKLGCLVQSAKRWTILLRMGSRVLCTFVTCPRESGSCSSRCIEWT